LKEERDADGEQGPAGQDCPADPAAGQPLYFLDQEIYVREQTSSMKATPEQVEVILSKFYR
jgi:hypothetical protein